MANNFRGIFLDPASKCKVANPPNERQSHPIWTPFQSATLPQRFAFCIEAQAMSSRPASPSNADVTNALRLQVAILKADLDALRAEKDDQEAFYNLRIYSLERELQSLRNATASTMAPPTSSRSWLRAVKLGRDTRSAPHHRYSKVTGGIHSILHPEDSQHPSFAHARPSSEHKGVYQRLLSIFHIGRLRNLWRRQHQQSSVDLPPPTSTTEWHARFGDNGKVYFVNPNDTVSAAHAETIDLMIANPQVKTGSREGSRGPSHSISGDSSWV